MKGDMDKSLFFITLAMVCVWLVVDTAIGNKHLITFLSTMFPFIDAPGSDDDSRSQGSGGTASPNAPSSSAVGSGSNSSSEPISGVPYGATRPGGGTR